jgi:DNA-binding NtrC family response regulator
MDIVSNESDDGEPLRVLILEDQATDADLTQRHLTREGLQFTAIVVDTAVMFEHQLATFHPHVVLADYSLPGYSGMSALAFVREQYPEVPFIILSGVIGDEAAASLIVAGAADYILKDRPARLVPAIRRAVAEATQRVERIQAEKQRDRLMTSVVDLIIPMLGDVNKALEQFSGLLVTVVSQQATTVAKLDQVLAREATQGA